MTSPLLPVGLAALGTLAVQTVRQLKPGDFLRELYGTDEKPAESAPAKTHSAAQTAADLSAAIPAFIEQLRTQLQSVGVELDQPIVLKEDGWGGVVVDGDHPHRTVIEELFASDESLRADFQQIARAATTQRDQSSLGFGPSLGEFRLQMDAGAAAIAFE
jgi:hypothetical protein